MKKSRGKNGNKNRKAMRIGILIAVLVVAVGGGLAAFYFGKSGAPKVEALSGNAGTEQICLSAHRGFSAVAPENSLPAFRAAGEAGFYAAECDVYPTKDGVWVISHDEDIKRMTNGKGKISELTFDELCAFSIDAGNGVKDYPGERIPTLLEYLEVCSEYRMRPEIELKGGNAEQIAEILTLLDAYDLREKAILISFDEKKLSVLREKDETLTLWYLTNEITPEAKALCLEKNFALAFRDKKVKEEELLSAKQEGITLCAWTVDSPARAEELNRLGVHYITTNAIAPLKAS